MTRSIRKGDVVIPGAEALLPRADSKADQADLTLRPAQRDALRAIVTGARQPLTAVVAGSDSAARAEAATAIANELGRALYRVDLGQVASKYIGETEKNLNRLFDAAEKADAILFFDEADALFGKRTDVKDAHDRFANVETGYLLQRIEAFKGVAILATNRKASLDDAFLRRIRYVVEL